MLARGLIGFGSAFAAISCLTIASAWFKDRLFSLLTGSLLSIGFAGSIVGVRWINAIIEWSGGWRAAIRFLALIGLAVTALVLIFVRNKTPNSKAPRQTGFETFRNRKTWLVATYSALLFTPTLIFAAEWGVSYFEFGRNFTATESQNLISNMLIGFVIGAPSIGAIARDTRKLKLFW